MLCEYPSPVMSKQPPAYHSHLSRAKFNEALATYQSGTDERFRRGEISRTSYVKSLVLAKLGRVEEAKKCRTTAEALRAKLGHVDGQSDNAHDTLSYDCLVSPWAR